MRCMNLNYLVEWLSRMKNLHFLKIGNYQYRGFFVVSPKRCIEKFEELDNSEKIEIFEIVDKTISILRKQNVCERFNVIFEEKENHHFHVWIMPRHEWIIDKFGNVMNNIKPIFEYAKNNMRNEETYNLIKEITNAVRSEWTKAI